MNYQEIFYWIISKQDERAKVWLADTNLQNLLDDLGTTYLHCCVRFNNKNILQYLINKGHNVDCLDILEYTPLMTAIHNNREEVAKVLLDAGADIDLSIAGEKSALQIALIYWDVSDGILQLMLKNLHEKYGSSKQTAKKLIAEKCCIFQAAFLKDFRVIEYMAKNQISVNHAHWIDKRTGIHISTELNDFKTLTVLTQFGADLQVTDHENANALHYIYKLNTEHNPEKIKILKTLLKQGLSPTTCTKNGDFQIGPTLMNGSSEAINVLLNSEIDFSARDNNGKTLFHYLAMNTNPGLAKVLECHIKNFEIDSVDMYHTTAVYNAAKTGNLEILQLLLDNKAKVNCIHSIYNFTPLHQVYAESKPALEDHYEKCAQLLLHHKANPQFITFQQQTIFDIVKEEEKIKPIIAQLALQNKLGTPVSSVVRSKINSQHSSRKYLKSCKRILEKRVTSSVKVFHLLADNRKKTIKYLNRRQCLKKTKKIKYKKRLKTNFSYYYSRIKKHLSKVTQFMESRNIVQSTLSKLLKGHMDASHVVIDKITNYLDYNSLHNLYKLGMSLQTF